MTASLPAGLSARHPVHVVGVDAALHRVLFTLASDEGQPVA